MISRNIKVAKLRLVKQVQHFMRRLVMKIGCEMGGNRKKENSVLYGDWGGNVKR